MNDLFFSDVLPITCYPLLPIVFLINNSCSMLPPKKYFYSKLFFNLILLLKLTPITSNTNKFCHQIFREIKSNAPRTYIKNYIKNLTLTIDYDLSLKLNQPILKLNFNQAELINPFIKPVLFTYCRLECDTRHEFCNVCEIGGDPWKNTINVYSKFGKDMATNNQKNNRNNNQPDLDEIYEASHNSGFNYIYSFQYQSDANFKSNLSHPENLFKSSINEISFFRFLMPSSFFRYSIALKFYRDFDLMINKTTGMITEFTNPRFPLSKECYLQPRIFSLDNEKSANYEKWNKLFLHNIENEKLKAGTKLAEYNFHSARISESIDKKSWIIEWSIYSIGEFNEIIGQQIQTVPDKLFIFYRKREICRSVCNSKYVISEWHYEEFDNLNITSFNSKQNLDILQKLRPGEYFQIKFSFNNKTFSPILPSLFDKNIVNLIRQRKNGYLPNSLDNKFDQFLPYKKQIIPERLNRAQIGGLVLLMISLIFSALTYACYMKRKNKKTKKGFLQQLRAIGLPDECNNLKNYNYKDFQLKFQVGEGHFGEVYKAILKCGSGKKFGISTKNGKKVIPVAVKILKKDERAIRGSGKTDQNADDDDERGLGRKIFNLVFCLFWVKSRPEDRNRKASDASTAIITNSPKNSGKIVNNRIFDDTAQEAILHNLATRISHKNLVQFHGISVKLKTDMTTFYILSEFCEGNRLEKYLNRQMRMINQNVYQTEVSSGNREKFKSSEGHEKFEETSNGVELANNNNEQKTTLSKILAKSLENYKFDEIFFFSVALQIGSACKHLIDQKIVHRDVACRNVLLHKKVDDNISIFRHKNLDSKSGLSYLVNSNSATKFLNFIQTFHVKLTDFGLARKMNLPIKNPTKFYTSPVDQAPIATYAFPPNLEKNVFDRNRGWNEKVEVWSFGVFLWELASCGNRPNLGPDGRPQKTLYGTPKIHQIMKDCWNANEIDRPNYQVICERIEKYLLASESKMKDGSILTGKLTICYENTLVEAETTDKNQNQCKKIPRIKISSPTPKLDEKIIITKVNSKSQKVSDSSSDNLEKTSILSQILPENLHAKLDRHLSNFSDKFLNYESVFEDQGSVMNQTKNSKKGEQDANLAEDFHNFVSKEISGNNEKIIRTSMIDQDEVRIFSNKSEYYQSLNEEEYDDGHDEDEVNPKEQVDVENNTASIVDKSSEISSQISTTSLNIRKNNNSPQSLNNITQINNTVYQNINPGFTIQASTPTNFKSNRIDSGIVSTSDGGHRNGSSPSSSESKSRKKSENTSRIIIEEKEVKAQNRNRNDDEDPFELAPGEVVYTAIAAPKEIDGYDGRVELSNYYNQAN